MKKKISNTKLFNYIEDETIRLSYLEIERLIDKNLNTLHNFDIKKEDVIIIECENTIDFIVLFLSLKKLRSTIVPISNKVTEKEFKNILSKVIPSCFLVKDLQKYTKANNYRKLSNGYSFRRVSTAKNNPIHECLIMHTSGTTGHSLPVALSLDSLDITTNKIADFLQIDHADTFLIAKNISHCSTLIGEVLTAISVNANLVLKNTNVSPKIILKRVKKYNATFVGLNPSLINLMTKISKETLLTKISIISSGDVLKPDTARNFRQKFPNAELINAYGLTEAGPRVAMNRLTSENYCCGYILNGVEVKIINENTGKTCSSQEVGEIFVKSDTLMNGYYNDRLSTENKFIGEWLKTSDLGYMYKNKLYVTGRSDMRIISGGRNIDPIKIENIIENRYKEISEVVVIGIADNFLGEKVICLFTSDQKGADEWLHENLFNDLTDELENYEIPKQFVKVDSLKKTASGKISRRLNKICFEKGELT